MKKSTIILTVLFVLSLVFQGCREEKEENPGSIYGMVMLKLIAEPMRATE